jgi:hypothetical protein
MPIRGQDVLDDDRHSPQGPCGVGTLGIHGASLGQRLFTGHVQQGLNDGFGRGDASRQAVVASAVISPARRRSRTWVRE